MTKEEILALSPDYKNTDLLTVLLLKEILLVLLALKDRQL